MRTRVLGLALLAVGLLALMSPVQFSAGNPSHSPSMELASGQARGLATHTSSQSAVNEPLASVTLSQDGLAPTLLGLTWTQSTDSFWTSYELDYSSTGSSGSWSLLANITTSKSFNFEWIYGLSPTYTYYWREITWGNFFGYYESVSNSLGVTQPNTATLTYTQPTGTSVRFAWTNGASYGGNISFGEYEINESVNGGAYSTVATVTQSSTHSYTLNGLSTGAGYSFYVATVDVASNAGQGYDFTTSSNIVTFGVNVSLTNQANAKPTSADAEQLISLSCVASGGAPPYTYSWDFGDGTTGTGSTVSHAYASEGSYTATCTVTDTKSSTSQSLVVVTISPSLVVNAEASHSAVSPDTIVYLNATISGGPGIFSSVTWNFGDGSSGSGNQATHSYSKPGDYHPSVSVTDGNGVVATASVAVNVSNLTITAAVTRTAGQPGTEFAFTASASGGGGAPFTFSWAFGDGTSGSGGSTQHAYTTAGNFTATVTVTDSLGGRNSTTLATVHVYEPLTARVSMTSSSPTPGQSVTLTALVGGGSGSYVCDWNFGDSNKGSGCSVAHSWATSGTYTVALTVIDASVGNVTSNSTVTVAASSASSTGSLGPAVGGIPLLLLAVVVILAVVLIVLLVRRKPQSGSANRKPRQVTAGAFCPNCGAPTPGDAAFCQKCGQPLGKS